VHAFCKEVAERSTATLYHRPWASGTSSLLPHVPVIIGDSLLGEQADVLADIEHMLHVRQMTRS